MDPIERRKQERPMYSEEEARQILDRAMGLQTQGREFSHDHLEQMALDLGISTEQLQLAEQSWRAEQEREREREAFIAHRRREFKSHLVTYLVVNSFLFALYLILFVFVKLYFPWFLFPLLGWGIAVALNAWSAYQSEGDEFDREFLKWRERRLLRQQHYREISS